jgi:hypothetical protein
MRYLSTPPSGKIDAQLAVAELNRRGRVENKQFQDLLP